MAKKRWSPALVVVVSEVLAFILLCVVGIAVAISNGSFDKNPEKAGEKIGQAGFPFLVAVGVIAYFVQKSRIRDDK